MNELTAEDREYAPVRKLTRAQRRVLGVLLEKAFTTPESYPLTLKAATAAANQKSNRDPVTNYSEDAVLQTLDELRELGLAAVLLTETGRTERYRHYMRKRFNFTEPQLAILTELLLRGRQQLGELRARASRMVPIESLDDLRSELTGLMDEGHVQASGPLERRGIEVDHSFYLPEEGHRLEPQTIIEEQESAAARPTTPTRAAAGPDIAVGALRQEIETLKGELEQLRNQQQHLREELDALKRALGA